MFTSITLSDLELIFYCLHRLSTGCSVLFSYVVTIRSDHLL